MGHQGNPGSPAGYLISDVLRLTNVGASDVYALRMTYNPALLNGGEAMRRQNGYVYLATNRTGYWVTP